MDIWQQTLDNQAILFQNRTRAREALMQTQEDFSTKLTYTSLALSGCSLTAVEVNRILDEDTTPEGCAIGDVLLAVGHGRAVAALDRLVGEERIFEIDIQNLHRVLIGPSDPISAGQYRKLAAFIPSARRPGSRPEEIARDMQNLCASIYTDRPKCHPVRFAAQLHKWVYFIHPFSTGNELMARLLLNVCLMQSGFLPLAIPVDAKERYHTGLRDAYEDDSAFCDVICQLVLEAQNVFLHDIVGI